MIRSGLVLLVFCAGCSEFSQFLPSVSFDGLEIRALTFEQADVDFVFQVENPNPVRLSLASFDYALELEDVPFLEGDNPEGFTLEPNGGSQLVLPVTLGYEDIWNTIQATRGEDVVDFLLSGAMGFDTPAGNIHLPYSEDGDFPALRTPEFSFSDVRVASFDLFSGTADLEVDLGVDNELGSTLFFENFDYDLTFDDTPVASGLVPSFDVDGATTGTVTLPVSVDLFSLGAGVVDAIVSGGTLDLGLDAAMDVDTPFGIVPLSIDETGAVSVD
jgi:LEA14-like dessication related protein